MTIYPSMLLSPAIAFSLSFIILTVVLKFGTTRYLAMDKPNQRSLHTLPVPRIGGIAIVIATLGTWSVLRQATPIPMLLAVILAGISYADDWKGLPVTVRLAAHALAAVVLVWSGFAGHGFWIAAGLALYVVWMTNAYNFMDGADGLAGGMTLFGFSAYGMAAWAAEAESLAATSFAVAAAAGGFLPFNFPPAKIFMGDVGSIPLGFLAAALGLMGWQQGIWPLWFPVLVFSPFLADASVTLLRRILRGDRFWQAHREHYYQRLIRMGWGHRRTALSEYLLMAGVAASAVAGSRFGAQVQMTMLFAWTLVFTCMMLAIDFRWRRSTRHSDEGK